MSRMLRIIGKDLDIDTFVSLSGLKPYKLSYKGQPRFKTKPEGEKLPYSVATFVASDADFNNLQQQIADVIDFLEQNKDKLAHIAATKEVEYATLDFGIDLTIDRVDNLTQSVLLPARLLALAGNLGLDIQLSIYPTDLQQILEDRTKSES